MTSDRIKLLLMVPTMGFGGTERQILGLCQGIDAKRFDVTLLVLKNAPGYLDSGTFPCKIIRLQLSHCYNLWEMPRLVRILRAGHFDIVHAFLPVADFWAALTCMMAGRPFLIGSSRNIDYPPPRWLYRWADRISFKYVCDIIISNSQWGKQVLCDVFGLAPEKVRVIANGYDFDRLSRTTLSREDFRKQLSIPEKATLVTSIGRLAEQKGMSYFIRMASILLRNKTDLYFLLVGEGPDRKALERLIQELRLRDRLKMVGHRQDIPNVLHASDFFVLPSLYEGCPNALLEALGSGLPAVTTDIPPHREFLTHGQDALLVAPADPQALAKAVTELLTDPAKAARLAKSGCETVRREFDRASMVSQYQTLYERSLNAAS